MILRHNIQITKYPKKATKYPKKSDKISKRKNIQTTKYPIVFQKHLFLSKRNFKNSFEI